MEQTATDLAFEGLMVLQRALWNDSQNSRSEEFIGVLFTAFCQESIHYQPELMYTRHIHGTNS